MSLVVTEGHQDKFELKKAILLYGSGSIGYATIHEVSLSEDETPEIRAGHPLTQDGLLALVRSLKCSLRTQNRGFLPDNVLVNDDNICMWFEPPTTRTVYFSSNGRIGNKVGLASHPGLIFALCEKRWYVFAYKGKKRPTASTRLYHAPYFNVWDSGQICVGSVPLPNGYAAENLKKWSDAFFNSNFSHTNHNRVVNYPEGAHAFWENHLEAKEKTFPTKVLVPHPHKTLGKFYDRLAD